MKKSELAYRRLRPFGGQSESLFLSYSADCTKCEDAACLDRTPPVEDELSSVWGRRRNILGACWSKTERGFEVKPLEQLILRQFAFQRRS